MTDEERVFFQSVLDELGDRMFERAKANAMPVLNWHEDRFSPKRPEPGPYKIDVP